MKTVMRFGAMVLLGMGLVGCGKSDGDGLPDTGANACVYPSGAALPSDAAVPELGCFAGPRGQLCTLLADGQTSCTDLCSASDFEMTCRGAFPVGQVPSPTESLGCKVIPMPTPSNVQFYCCPCAK